MTIGRPQLARPVQESETRPAPFIRDGGVIREVPMMDGKVGYRQIRLTAARQIVGQLETLGRAHCVRVSVCVEPGVRLRR